MTHTQITDVHMKCTFHFIHRWMSDYDIAHSLHSFLQHLETKSVRLKIWYAISHKNSFKMFLHLNAAYLTCMEWIKLLILMFNYFYHVYQHLLQSLPISLLQTKRIRTYMKNDPRWRIADRGPRSRTAVRAEQSWCTENMQCAAIALLLTLSLPGGVQGSCKIYKKEGERYSVHRNNAGGKCKLLVCTWLPGGGWCLTAEST